MKKIKTAILLVFSLILLAKVNAPAQITPKKSGKKEAANEKTAKSKKSAESKLKSKAPAFELEDQFKKKFAFKFPSKKVTVFIFGDRKGSEQIEGWVRPLYEKYTDKIEIYGIAELSAVPGIAKGFVRNLIKSKSKNSIMLDWSGKVSKDFGSENEKANLFVVSRAGEIIAEKRGAATSTELEDLHKIIGDSLD
jgi:hypothetical protein